MNRIVGGSRGNSGGNVSRALKKPPSLNVTTRSTTKGNGWTTEAHTRASRVVWVVIVSERSGDLAWDTPDDHDLPLEKIAIINKPFDANSVRMLLEIEAVQGQ